MAKEYVQSSRSEMYASMNEWAKFMRRDDDSIFSALFHDQEIVNSTDVEEFVEATAKFFDLPIPDVYNSCETLAKVISHNNAQYEVHYDWKKLCDAGINNKDAFKLVLTHELCHHVFKSVRFGFCRNESWNQELMSDFVAGIRSKKHYIASGKYKYAIGTTKACPTHPPGYFRKGLFDLGRKTAERLEHNDFNIHDVTDAFCYIMEVNKKRLNEEWSHFVIHSDDPKPKTTPIEDLPDTNLIKIAVLKYRKEQAEQKQQNQK